MTDVAVRPTTTPQADRPRATTTPRGVPRWVRWLGVTVHPVGSPDPAGRAAWVVSVGGGTTGVAALFVDTTGQDQQSREDQR